VLRWRRRAEAEVALAAAEAAAARGDAGATRALAAAEKALDDILEAELGTSNSAFPDEEEEDEPDEDGESGSKEDFSG
jgi:predicted DNA-binding transcriptional regulator YafY